jgi:hypothetical protein
LINLGAHTAEKLYLVQFCTVVGTARGLLIEGFNTPTANTIGDLFKYKFGYEGNTALLEIHTINRSGTYVDFGLNHFAVIL